MTGTLNCRASRAIRRNGVIPPTRHTLGWMKSIPPASSSSRNWASVYRLSPAATGMPIDARRSA